MTKQTESLGPLTAVYEHTEDGWWVVSVLEIPGANSQGETYEEVQENIREAVQELTQTSQLNSIRDSEVADALSMLVQAWPHFISECRSVLGSELHYQAMLYHCLRTYGAVPLRQLGMNVKMWITEVVSEHFRMLDERKAEGYRGGFEPIPDVVIFRPQIKADFRRRNRENTLRQMLVAIEVKASEREGRRLRAGEIVDDIVKLEALQIEARHKGSNVLPVVVTIDTAPEENERMTPDARRETEAAARERGVCLFYVSPSDTSVVLSEVL